MEKASVADSTGDGMSTILEKTPDVSRVIDMALPPFLCTALALAVNNRQLNWSPSAGVTDGTQRVQKEWTFQLPHRQQPQKVAYVQAGRSDHPPVLLVHGFGASAYHWRANVNALADAGNCVYAVDLLGFGASDKPLIEYDADVWVHQCADFLRQVAGCGGENGKRAVVAGNSIGGFTVLALAALHPNLVRGIVSLNGAGRFSDTQNAVPYEREEVKPSSFSSSISNLLTRFIVYAGFWVTKQPARIQQVLRQVYPVNPERACEELVASIEYPARHPNAAEVFYRIVSRNGNGPPSKERAVDILLRQLQCPILLLFGIQDPWIRPVMADRMLDVCREHGRVVSRVDVVAGHCPMDESPEEVNRALIDFIDTLPPES